LFIGTTIITFIVYKSIYKIMDLDELIYLFKRYTISDQQKNSELGEQDAATATSTAGGSTGAAYPTVTKWETGLTRSVANQIDYKAKWKDLNKITRGKANTLL
jgi:hypothetical protein